MAVVCLCMDVKQQPPVCLSVCLQLARLREEAERLSVCMSVYLQLARLREAKRLSVCLSVCLSAAGPPEGGGGGAAEDRDRLRLRPFPVRQYGPSPSKTAPVWSRQVPRARASRQRHLVQNVSRRDRTEQSIYLRWDQQTEQSSPSRGSRRENY